MAAPHLKTSAVAKLLTDVQAALKGSDWTTYIVERRPESAKITQGKWTAAKITEFAKHYGEKISSSEAIRQATARNKHILNLARHAIKIAAQTACTNWITLLWSDRSKPHSTRQEEAGRLEAQESFLYEEACCALLTLQIEDTVLKIEQTELRGVEHFTTYFVTRLGAEHGQVHRRITIYSSGNIKNVITASKAVALDGGQFIETLARLMPVEAHDKDSVVHKLTTGFAPPDEVFEIWVQQQIDTLREKYKNQIPKQDLEKLLAQLQEQSFEAKAQHAKLADKVTAKDIAYFSELLQKELV